MKSDELKAYKNIARVFDATTQQEQVIAEDSGGYRRGFNSCEEFYPKEDVDAAIAELKAKLENVQASAYAESVDANMENRRLKRALWRARAERAVAKQAYYDILSRGISSERGEMYDMWNNVERKCRAKAEEWK